MLLIGWLADEMIIALVDGCYKWWQYMVLMMIVMVNIGFNDGIIILSVFIGMNQLDS